MALDLTEAETGETGARGATYKLYINTKINKDRQNFEVLTNPKSQREKFFPGNR
jgi:hypothetical protein